MNYDTWKATDTSDVDETDDGRDPPEPAYCVRCEAELRYGRDVLCAKCEIAALELVRAKESRDENGGYLLEEPVRRGAA